MVPNIAIYRGSTVYANKKTENKMNKEPRVLSFSENGMKINQPKENLDHANVGISHIIIETTFIESCSIFEGKNFNCKKIINELSTVAYPLTSTSISVTFPLGNIDYLDLFIDKIFGPEKRLFYFQNSKKEKFIFKTNIMKISECLELLVQLKKNTLIQE